MQVMQQQLQRSALRRCHGPSPVSSSNSSSLSSLCSTTGRGFSAAQPSRRSRYPHRCEASTSAEAAPQGPVIVVDNYDSFTYNLCQYLGDLACDYRVIKNDELTVEQIRATNPRGILISPGPGKPTDSGISLQTVLELGPDFPLFGVCMGHQCIGEAFGGDVVRAPTGVMHGKTSPVFHTNTGLLEGLPNPFQACRYHSLVIKRESLPDCLEVTAWTEDGTIMGVRHKQFPHIEGVQFHPESIITESGKMIVGNFVKRLSPAH